MNGIIWLNDLQLETVWLKPSAPRSEQAFPILHREIFFLEFPFFFPSFTAILTTICSMHSLHSSPIRLTALSFVKLKLHSRTSYILNSFHWPELSAECISQLVRQGFVEWKPRLVTSDRELQKLHSRTSCPWHTLFATFHFWKILSISLHCYLDRY